MSYRERTTSDHRIMLGKPVVKGTRLTIELLLRKLSEGATIPNLFTMNPNLHEADVLAALDYKV